MDRYRDNLTTVILISHRWKLVQFCWAWIFRPHVNKSSIGSAEKFNVYHEIEIYPDWVMSDDEWWKVKSIPPSTEGSLLPSDSISLPPVHDMVREEPARGYLWAGYSSAAPAIAAILRPLVREKPVMGYLWASYSSAASAIAAILRPLVREESVMGSPWPSHSYGLVRAACLRYHYSRLVPFLDELSWYLLRVPSAEPKQIRGRLRDTRKFGFGHAL